MVHPGRAALLSGNMIEPELPLMKKYCVRIWEYQFMKQPGARAGKSECNSIPILHAFTDEAENLWHVIGGLQTPVQTMAAVTRHPRWCSDASPYPMDGLPVSTDQIEFSQPVKQIRRCKSFIFPGGRFPSKVIFIDKSDCTAVTYLDIKRIQVELMCDVGIILLRFKTVLPKRHTLFSDITFVNNIKI